MSISSSTIVFTLASGLALTCVLSALAQQPLSGVTPTAFLSPSLSPSVTPIVRVTLSQPVYDIEVDPHSGAPHMPRNVVAAAEVQNWPADRPMPKIFDWHIGLDWNYPKFPTHHDIDRLTFERPSPFVIDFGKQIRGGTLTVHVKTLLDGRLLCGQATAIVRGVNPSPKAILNAFPPTRFGLIASKVAMTESSMRQFTVPHGKDPGGMPEMSRTHDLGIMQLNAPTWSITSQDQIWDWRENVRRGMGELMDKQRMAVLASRQAAGVERLADKRLTTFFLLNFYRKFVGLPPLPMPQVPALSGNPGSGIVSGDPDVDHVALSQIERDTIRRYNGGREYAFTIVPDAFLPTIHYAGWQIDPSRGGIQARSGDLDYVRHVLRAQSGLKLPLTKSVQKIVQKKPLRKRH